MLKIYKKNKFGFISFLFFIVCTLFCLIILQKTSIVFANQYYSDEEISFDSEFLELYSQDGTIQKTEILSHDEKNVNNNVEVLSNIPIFNEKKILNSEKPDSESLVITIMGDGFTSTEQEKFINAATSMIDKLLGNPDKGINGFYPYNLFRESFTVYAIEVISNETGVSRDASPNNGNIVDNYFGSSFEDMSCERTECLYPRSLRNSCGHN